MTSQRRKERRKVGGSGALVSVFGISVTFQNNSLKWVAAAQTQSSQTEPAGGGGVWVAGLARWGRYGAGALSGGRRWLRLPQLALS